MDLRLYLQEDMTEFLDNRLSVEYLKEQTTNSRMEDSSGFSRDFEAELFTALQHHDVYQAKKVLHEVRDLFSTYPVGSSERRQLEAILRSLYEKFKEYIETENTLNKLEEGISHVDDPHTFLKEDKELSSAGEQSIPAPQKEFRKETSQKAQPTKTASSSLPQKNDTANTPSSPSFLSSPSSSSLPSSQEEKPTSNPANKQGVAQKTMLQETEQKENSYLTKELDLSIQSLRDAIVHKDRVFARKEYARTKNCYEQLSIEQKKFYKEKIVILYSQLATLLATTQEVSQKKTSDKETPERTSMLAKEKLQREQSQSVQKEQQIQQEQQEKQELKEQQATQTTVVSDKKTLLSPEKKKLYAIEKDLRQAITDGELHEAMLHYEELREIIHSLPQDQQHEHVSRAHTYYDWLMKAWRQYQVSHPTIQKHERRLTGKP